MDTVFFIVLMLLAGTGAGIASAGLGLGGGIVMVPAFLTLVPGMDAHTAKGTSMLIIIFISLQNAWQLTRQWPARPWRLAGLMASGSIIGGYTGAWITTFMSEAGVLWIFIALLGGLALRTFLLRPKFVHEEEVRQRNIVPVFIGLSAGVVGGATGTGGGLVLVPLALYAGLITNERVVGLSNMVIVVTSVAGTLAHLRAPEIYLSDWSVGQVYFLIAPVVFIGAQAGSLMGLKLNAFLTLPRRRVAMGSILFLIALRLMLRLVIA